MAQRQIALGLLPISVNLTDPAFEHWAAEHLPRSAAKALSQTATCLHCDFVKSGMVLESKKRTVEDLDATSDRLSAIQDHEDAKAAQALGRNTYVLPIIAAAVLSFGFLTGLFGINVVSLPLIGSQSGFAVVAGRCVAIEALVVVVFRFLRGL